MRPLRIAVVLPDPPLPFGSAAARWYYVLLKELARRGRQVTAFAAYSRQEDLAAITDLFPSPQHDLRCYPIRHRRGLAAKWETLCRPYSYVYSPGMRGDLCRELERGFDVLHLEQLWSGWLGLKHTRRALVNVHFSCDIDLTGQPAASLADRLLRKRAWQAERRLLRSYQTLCTLSPRLSAFARKINPAASVHTVPFGMEANLYRFTPEPRECGPAPMIGLIGSFNWTPSYLAGIRLLTRLWPEIKRQVPNARLQLAGRYARTAFRQFEDLSGLSLHEDVPDILPYFQSTDVLIYAPGQGSGMKVKILEAFALGVPVVTNSEGIEGIPAEDGVHAGICEDDSGLVARTVALIRDSALRQRMRIAARALVQDYCSPRLTVDAIEAVHTRIADRASAGVHTGISLARSASGSLR